MIGRLLLLGMLSLAGSGCLQRHPDPPAPAIVAGGGPNPAPAARSFRIVSFNVQRKSAAALARAIQSDAALRSADVILLQELDAYAQEGADRAALLGQALGMAHAYAPRYQIGRDATHGLGIVSRFPLEEAEVIELPQYNLHFRLGRVIALGVTIRLAETPVRIYNTHLDTRIRPGERVRQLRPLVGRPGDGQRPVVVAGDFNSTPFTWLLRRVPFPSAANNARIERMMAESGFQMAADPPRSTTRWLGLTIDWVYQRGLRFERGGVADRVRLSDHYPVWADLRLP